MVNRVVRTMVAGMVSSNITGSIALDKLSLVLLNNVNIIWTDSHVHIHLFITHSVISKMWINVNWDSSLICGVISLSKGGITAFIG